jgi:hypothetical protein
MQHLIKEYIESEYPRIEVSNLYELNNKYDGSTLTYSVTGVDKNGFEISEEIDINVWKVLVFINNKIK